MKKLLFYFPIAFTIVVIVLCLLWLTPFPFFDSGNITFVTASKADQIDVARGLSASIGDPTVELNTKQIDRYLFKDGTSVDFLKLIPITFTPKYKINALKSIVVPWWKFWDSPRKEAQRIKAAAGMAGDEMQIIDQPDPAFPKDSLVMILSDSFQTNCTGFGYIIRKNAFFIGGQRPSQFKSFPPPKP